MPSAEFATCATSILPAATSDDRGPYRDSYRAILGIYGDNGKENGNYRDYRVILYFVVPNIGFRALKWRIKWKRKWKIKWKLGFYRGYLCSILFGSTMAPNIE